MAADSDRALWFSAYVQTYLERDLRNLSSGFSLPDFQRVMALAAHGTGRLLNQAELARDAARAGIKSGTDATNRPDAGFWLEQTLLQTLQTWRAVDPLHRRLHFRRDHAGHEVDFVLEQAERRVAIEIKMGSTVTSSDAAGIRAFRDSRKRKWALARGVVLHAGEARPLATDLFALPRGWMVPA